MNQPQALQPLVMVDLLKKAQAPDAPWKDFRPGVMMLPIYSGADGQSSALLRYAPGAAVPAHVHTGYEHILVLSGTQTDERGTYQAGTMVVNPPGFVHSVHSADGCIILVIWERPVAFV